MLAVLLIGLGWGIGYGTTVLLRPVPVVPVPPPVQNGAKSPAGAESTALSPELELRYQLLKNQLDNAAENSKQLDRLVTLLLTLTSLYALALGLSSYFGLKQILDTGKDELVRLREFLRQSRIDVQDELAKFGSQLHEKYPELADLHGNLRDLLKEIRLMFQPGQNWAEEYGKLTPKEREKFALAELRLAGLEVFRLRDLESFRLDVRQIYQGLGRFYSSKFRKKKRRSDWERALLYFDTAVNLESASRSAALLKDWGLHLTQLEVARESDIRARKVEPAEMREIETLRSRAVRAFYESLTINQFEPGALFGLGWVLYKKTKYQDAIKQYALLTTIAEPNPEVREKYLEDAYLNQAGCYSLMSSTSSSDTSYTTSLNLLEESKKVALEYGRLCEWREKVVREGLDGGDLAKLRNTRMQEFDTFLA